MRKISLEAVNSFENRKRFAKGNTNVINESNLFLNGTNYESVTVLKLHSNSIAYLTNTNELYITNAGWQSNTTKERLNSLPNVSIYQKDFEWYLNGKKWNGELTKV